jgi:hypothetical protein
MKMENLSAPHEATGIKPVVGHEMTPTQAAAGQKTVKMIFPRPLRLSISQTETINFRAGTHEVPEIYADHWYLAAGDAMRAEQ